MPRWLKKSCFASLFALVACGGSGGGGCGGCSGVNPLPQGFPKDSRIENSANLRFTDSGFAFLSDNLGTLATKLLPAGGNGANGVITFNLASDPAGIDLAGVGKACEGGSDPNAKPPKCVIEIDLQHAKLKLASAAPHNMKVTGTIPIRAQYIPLKAIGIGMKASLGDGSCKGGVSFTDVPMDVDISIETDVDPAHGIRTGLSKVKINKLDPKLGQNQLQLCTDCDIPILCGIGDSLLNSLKNALFGVLVDQIKKPLTSQIDNALCIKGSKDTSPPCPVGSTPEDPKNPDQGKCLFPDNSCVGMALGTEGNLDLGKFLASISPSTSGGLDFQFAMGGPSSNPDANGNTFGDMNPIAGGATFSLVGGALPNPVANCVAQVALDKPKNIPTPAELLTNKVADWPSNVAGPHFGVGVSERFFNYALGGIYNSGALCIQLTTEQQPLLTASKIGLLAKSLKTLLIQKTDQQLGIVVRPTEPPTIKFGNGTDVKTDPNLNIDLKNAALDIYVFSVDRFIRAFTITLDLNVPMNLDVTKEGLTPVLEKIGITNAKLTNNQLISDDPKAVASGFQDLVSGLAGQFLGGFKPIDISGLLSSLGLTFTIPPSSPGKGSPGLRKLTKNTDNFLGIFGTLGIAPASGAMMLPGTQSNTQVTFIGTDVTPEGVHVRTMTPENAPVVRVAAGSSVDALYPVEYSYRVDKGAWHPWTQARVLDVRDDILRFQGNHEVTVRSRVVGSADTEAEWSKVAFRIDADPPVVALRHVEDGFAVDAVDSVSPTDELRGRYAIGSKAFSDWLPLSELTHITVPDGETLRVEVKDQEGRVGTVSQALRGRPDATGKAASSGCGCTVPGERSSSNGLPLGALAVAGVLAYLRARRRKVASAAAGVAAVSVMGSWSGCNCGGDPIDEAETPPTGTDAGTDADADASCDPKEGCIPLKPGLIGAYTSVAVASDGKTAWVAGYNEADYDGPASSYGDLVVGKWTGTKVDWKTVDGLDPKEEVDPTQIDVTGWRAGFQNSGPDVGLWTSIAMGDGDKPVVAYFDVSAGALKVATFDGTKWSSHKVDGKDKAIVGKYAKLVMIDKKPIIAYLSMEAAADGGVTSKVRVARAKSATPAATTDWTIEDVGSPVAAPCRAFFCGTGTACVTETKKCTKTATCPAKCGTGEACVMGATAPECKPVKDKTWVDAYPDAYGLYVSAAVTSKKDVGLVFYDRIRGNLHKAEKNGAMWKVDLIDGQLPPKDAMDVGQDTGDTGIGATLFIDKAGDWHIAYVDGAKEAVKYMKLPGGVAPGTIELIDGGGDPANGGQGFADGLHIVGDDANIVVDATNTVRVTYQDATAGTLRLATRGADGKWAVKVLKQDGRFAGFFSQQVTLEGKPMIANWWRVNGTKTEGDVAFVAPLRRIGTGRGDGRARRVRLTRRLRRRGPRWSRGRGRTCAPRRRPRGARPCRSFPLPSWRACSRRRSRGHARAGRTQRPRSGRQTRRAASSGAPPSSQPWTASVSPSWARRRQRHPASRARSGRPRSYRTQRCGAKFVHALHGAIRGDRGRALASGASGL